jgi:hypothetical protein
MRAGSGRAGALPECQCLALVFEYAYSTRAAEGVRRYWATLKHHNPKTARKNVGEDYHGRLRIDVRSSADLYRRIEGRAAASMAARPAREPGNDPRPAAAQ